jgi:hypothetical protein
MIDKLKFGKNTIIYRKKLIDMIPYKNDILKKCEEVISLLPDVKTDGYGYIMEDSEFSFDGRVEIKNELDKIVQIGIDTCVEIYTEMGNLYNLIQTDGWVNVVRAKEPVQIQFKENMHKYHIHTEINKVSGQFFPTFTYVYYIQMPDNLEGEDGVLYFLDDEGVEHFILPNEGDLIIMNGDLPHAPNHALKSTKDRIVFAGNVGLRFVKKNKSLI